MEIKEDQYLQGTNYFYCPLHYKRLFKKKGLCGKQRVKVSKLKGLENPRLNIIFSVSWHISQVRRLFGLFFMKLFQNLETTLLKLLLVPQGNCLHP